MLDIDRRNSRVMRVEPLPTNASMDPSRDSEKMLPGPSPTGMTPLSMVMPTLMTGGTGGSAGLRSQPQAANARTRANVQRAKIEERETLGRPECPGSGVVTYVAIVSGRASASANCAG